MSAATVVCLGFLVEDSPAAVGAEDVGSRPQLMVYCDALIEHKALASPLALRFRNVFEVLKNSTLEVVDVLEPTLQQVGGRLLAADTAGTEHGDGGVDLDVRLLRKPGWKVAESLRFRILGTDE